MEIEYQFGSLEQGAMDVTACVNKILGEVDHLQGAFARAHSTWESSSASGAYATLHTHWRSKHEEISQALSRFSSAIEMARQEMQSTERKGTAMLA